MVLKILVHCGSFRSAGLRLVKIREDISPTEEEGRVERGMDLRSAVFANRWDFRKEEMHESLA